MTRTNAKYNRKWQCDVQIQGVRVRLGPYEYRSEAAIADNAAAQIRTALNDHQKSMDRTKLIERYRFKEYESAIKDSGVVR